ncbi:MAG: type VI secretion system transmembrane protein TssO [Paludibacteraceae bacterium]|nr:type VI secretion system transmembrane protein TssO [Paludibacteraceae bacterium]
MGRSKTVLTSKEKEIGMMYVVLLYVLTTSACAYILFFYNADNQFANGKKEALAQMERVCQFQAAQSSHFDKITAIDNSVNKINPEVNASYEKREINYTIGELKKIYSDNKYDARYRIFEQAASFYELKLFDRERLTASQKNIEKFRRELDNCRGGVETLKNN